MIAWQDDTQKVCICDEGKKPKHFENLYDIIEFLKDKGMSNDEICKVHVTDDDGVSVYNISLWSILNYMKLKEEGKLQ